MNLVLDDAEEVHMKTKNRKPLGKSASLFVKLFYYFTLFTLLYFTLLFLGRLTVKGKNEEKLCHQDIVVSQGFLKNNCPAYPRNCKPNSENVGMLCKV